MGFSLPFFNAPPPPPPPPPPLPPYVVGAAALAVVALCLFGVAYYYVSTRWQGWINVAVERAFKKTDTNGSGTIDRAELYTGVLELYLQLHLYGINVKAPKKPVLLKLVDTLDKQGDELDYAEFKQVLEVLLAQTFSRFSTQMGLKIMCPVTAPLVCNSAKLVLGKLVPTGLGAVPASVVAFTAVLPPALDETLVAGAMLMLVAPALSLVDSLSLKAASKKAQKKTA